MFSIFSFWLYPFYHQIMEINMSLQNHRKEKNISENKSGRLNFNFDLLLDRNQKQKESIEIKPTVIAANENFSIIQAVKPVDFFYELKRN